MTAISLRSTILRPLEILVASVHITLGSASPATLRGNLGTVVVLVVAWFASSLWFDTLIAPGKPFLWFRATFEVIAGTVALYVLLHRHGDPRRFWRAWMAMVGVSILHWLLAASLFLGSPLAYRTILYALPIMFIIRGYGRVLANTFDGQGRYWMAFALTLSIALVSTATHKALTTQDPNTISTLPGSSLVLRHRGPKAKETPTSKRTGNFFVLKKT